MPFLKTSHKRPEKIRAPEIRFLGQQDGTPERLLTARLANLFHHDKSVTKAYLARVDFGKGKDTSVVLGLRTHLGLDEGVVEKVGTIFASVFNAKEHLDIMFLTDSEEAKLSEVCKPFFEK